MQKSLLLQISARITRRFPWFGRWMFIVYRLFVARFTVAAAVLITNADGAVLLAKHRFHPVTPWGFPGGVVERGEDPAHTARREIQEELGLAVTLHHIIDVAPSERYRQHMLVLFHGTLDTVDISQAQLSVELDAVDWFKADNLPQDMHPLQRAYIERFFSENPE